ncbi:helix-turn-helix domain-containing protein [Clostridium beijerinckii]|uniref:helix-turn-helix domain-containing protein n=1 Tax=Clostridium beijerinckii TaxID=1520 RepID=UPI00098C9FD6|nr:helix-turn-helix domain-containing protein [Clostridium beijerinckii]NRT79453.1 DNA-binding XRE family transcriptional regulator [Clostridium beijerinckii]OOM41537.1 hypothetical protein CBEIJ_44670 [Clostridium beijerinckii]
MNKIKLARNELMELLNVKNEALKQIEKNNQLSQRLDNKGYNFIEKIKKGRNNYYIVESQYKDDENYKLILTNIIEQMYKTREYLSFSEYFTIRYVFAKVRWQGATIPSIAEKVGVSESTIKKWDKLLKSNELIKQDGYYYYKKDMETYEEIEISQEEYKSYWRNKVFVSAMKSLQDKYDRGEITFAELQVGIMESGEILKAIEGKYCFRVKKYIVNEFNQLCGDMFGLIKKVFLTDIGLDYIEIKI